MIDDEEELKDWAEKMARRRRYYVAKLVVSIFMMFLAGSSLVLSSYGQAWAALAFLGLAAAVFFIFSDKTLRRLFR